MPVTWDRRRGRRWDDAALAVPCPICNAEPGRICAVQIPLMPESHPTRAMIAETLGFSATESLPLFRK